MGLEFEGLRVGVTGWYEFHAPALPELPALCCCPPNLFPAQSSIIPSLPLPSSLIASILLLATVSLIALCSLVSTGLASVSQEPAEAANLWTVAPPTDVVSIGVC